MHSSPKSSRGCSLPELIFALTVSAGAIFFAHQYVSSLHSEITRLRDAQTLTKLADLAQQSGAKIGPGPKNQIDTTSARSAIASINQGFSVNGVTIRPPAPIDPENIQVEGEPPHIYFVVR